MMHGGKTSPEISYRLFSPFKLVSFGYSFTYLYVKSFTSLHMTDAKSRDHFPDLIACEKKVIAKLFGINGLP